MRPSSVSGAHSCDTCWLRVVWSQHSLLCLLLLLLLLLLACSAYGMLVPAERERVWVCGCAFLGFSDLAYHGTTTARFLDCLWQLVNQFPEAFEFNADLLVRANADLRELRSLSWCWRRVVASRRQARS